MDRSEKYSLILLAGGKSSRMGRDKAELSYRGETFLEQMIAKGEQLGIRRIYVSGHEYARTDVRVVWDRYPRRGPLGGIHACMREMDTPYCLVLPVAAPQLPVAVLEAPLRQHEGCAEKDKVLIWKHDDREEPLVAIYPVAMANHLEALISDGPASVFHALKTWGYDCLNVAVSAEESMNINTPDTYQQLLQRSGEEVMEKETIHLRRICCGGWTRRKA